MNLLNHPMKALLIPLFVLAGGLPVQAVVDFSEWPNAMPIKLNTGASGANVSTTLQNFPVLIKLTGSNFAFDQAMTNGEDIRFSRNIPGQGHQDLPFQIERFDKSGKLAEIWVKVDAILGNDENQAIIMHWGHPAPPVSPYLNSGAVFGVDNSYSAVWHLSESGATVADVAGPFTGAKNGSNPAVVNGQAGLGQSFNGSSGYIDLGGGNFINQAAELTLEAWIDRNAEGGKILGVTVENSTSSRAQLGLNGSGKALLEARTLSGESLESHVSNNTLSSTFTYVVGIVKYATGDLVLCIDGVCEAAKAVSFDAAALPNSNSQAGVIGAEESRTSAFWNGIIDEARISRVARSPDWIKLCYENLKAGQKFVQVQTQFLPMVGGVIYGDVDMNGYTIQDAGTVVTRKWRVKPPDYVFDRSYALPSLASTEQFIKKNGHLPGIPSAKEIERDGLDLGTMNLRLLKEVEHLHLYILKQEKRILELEKGK